MSRDFCLQKGVTNGSVYRGIRKGLPLYQRQAQKHMNVFYKVCVFCFTLSMQSRVCAKPNRSGSSSFFTSFRKSHSQQAARFCSSWPWIRPPHKEPETTQQARPAFFPPCKPSRAVYVAAGQAPNSFSCKPPGSLPHFFTCQQFNFIALPGTTVFMFLPDRSVTARFCQSPCGRHHPCPGRCINRRERARLPAP